MSDTAVTRLVKEVEEEIDVKNAEIAELTGNLVVEKDELVAALKKLTRGSKAPDAPPATSDAVLLEAVAHVSKDGPAKSPDIAKFLGVDPRTISRRLSAFAKDGTIQGDKDSGYSG